MRAIHVWAACAAALVVSCALLLAGGLRPFLGPPTPEQRVMSIAADLRCPVCAGESVATSSAAVAVQMRAQIAQELQAGEGRRQIVDGFVREYGTWILFRPPGSGALALLWLVPAAAAVAVGVGVARYLRSRPVRAGGAGGGDPPAPPEGTRAPEADPLRRRLIRFL